MNFNQIKENRNLHLTHGSGTAEHQTQREYLKGKAGEKPDYLNNNQINKFRERSHKTEENQQLKGTANSAKLPFKNERICLQKDMYIEVIITKTI